MSIEAFIRNFAEAQMRQMEITPITEREIHDERYEQRPVGEGWIKISVDPHGYATWERTRFIKAAREWTP